MSHGGTNTIVSSVSTSDDNNIFALRADVLSILKVGVEKGRGITLQQH